MGIIKISAMANAKILEGVWDNVVTNHKECWVELHSTNVRLHIFNKICQSFCMGKLVTVLCLSFAVLLGR
jgi:hypothetical protein|tara:strand:+ start:806 stop:1015 length:210 start_codon:yes stop_codon:yes gene_type:complete